MNTDAALLRAFVTVARTSSFGRAAELLHLDPSTVSRQVGQLERRLGLTLFERTTRQVWLTDAGATLLDRAAGVIAAVDEFRRAAHAVDRQQSRQIVLGFQTHALNLDVLTWIRDAEEAAEVAPVRLVEGNFTDPTTGLRERSSDLALVFLPFEDDGIEVAPIVELPWLMFLPSDHPCAHRRTLHLAELFEEPWVRPDTTDEVFGAYWAATDLRDGVEPPPAPAYGTPESALAVIASGRAVGVGASIRDSVQLDGVVAIPVADERRAVVALGWRTDGLSAPARALRDALLRSRPDLHRYGRVVL